MILSLALILALGFTFSGILNKIKLPGLLGMILTGVILGPGVFNAIDPKILNISSELRQIALIVILMRAGLSIDLKDLKKVGRPAILMCFVPATFEILAVTGLAPLLFHISYLEAAILGTVLAAVSPAVIVPRMLHLMETGEGKSKSIPQLIMAGASIDDIYVIVLFTALLGLYKGESLNVLTFIEIPIAIILGLLIGLASGFILTKLFKKIHMRDTVKVLIILSTAFFLVSFESLLKTIVPFSGLLAVMAMGASILKYYEVLAKRLMGKFSKLWVAAEILLFVLVGAAVNINNLSQAGIYSLILIIFALVIRTLGVNISLLKTPLNFKERIFCSIAYIPKATVQAAIGAIPLANGVTSGNLILTTAVLAIFVSAPLGAIGIDLTHSKLLNKS